MSEAPDAPEGFFIDWDSKARPIDQPGKGYRCEVDKKSKYVMVLNKYGGLDHESTWYPTIADIEKAGIKVVHADLTAPVKITSIE